MDQKMLESLGFGDGFVSVVFSLSCSLLLSSRKVKQKCDLEQYLKSLKERISKNQKLPANILAPTTLIMPTSQ